MPNSASSRASLRHVAVLLALPLCGCVVGPDYRRPAIDVPVAWRLGANEAGEISNIAWWDQSQDPILSNLVHTAVLRRNVGRPAWHLAVQRFPASVQRPV